MLHEKELLFCYFGCNHFFAILFIVTFYFKTANQEIFKQRDLQSAHVGISIYDVAANSFLYNYQGDKYFIPASNTKLFSLYAGMKYLGDSLIGIRYIERDTDILVMPTGDPTLLHRDFIKQPVVDFLKGEKYLYRRCKLERNSIRSWLELG